MIVSQDITMIVLVNNPLIL